MSSSVCHNPNLVVGGAWQGWRPMQSRPSFPAASNNHYHTYPEPAWNPPKPRDCREVFSQTTNKTPTAPSDPSCFNPLFANFKGANSKTYPPPALADSGFNPPTSDGKIFEYPATTLPTPAVVGSDTTPSAPSAAWTHGWSTDVITEVDEAANDSDSEDDVMPTHPNKYPVEIEYHDNRFCSYQRQPTRSGERFQVRQVNTLHPTTLQPWVEMQQNRFYQKHLVRICRCGKYQGMDGQLQQGRANDCNGYEIHYSQKCRWKAYDDFKTGKRVLIRLCKCYKPIKN